MQNVWLFGISIRKHRRFGQTLLQFQKGLFTLRRPFIAKRLAGRYGLSSCIFGVYLQQIVQGFSSTRVPFHEATVIPTEPQEGS
ncbi:hypothetical protein FKM82_024818 [Ascaphus truei]